MRAFVNDLDFILIEKTITQIQLTDNSSVSTYFVMAFLKISAHMNMCIYKSKTILGVELSRRHNPVAYYTTIELFCQDVF